MFFILVCTILLQYEHIDVIYVLFAILNAFISIKEIFREQNRSFTLHKVVNVFILFFFVIANALQYNMRSIVTSLHVVFTDSDYCIFQIWVTMILCIFNFAYRYVGNKKQLNFIKNKYTLKSEKILLLTALVATLIVIAHFRGDFVRLFFRGLESDMASYSEDMESNVANSLLFGKIIRPIPVVCYLLGVLSGISKKNKLLLFIMMLVTSFPLGLARNAVAMYWLPVIMSGIPVLRRKNVFVISLMFGLLVIFPFFDNFRYYNGDISFQLSFNYFNTMNFDASQEMMYIMKNEVITYGYQLIGVLLFFVPRSIWPTKPIGSGAYIASQQGAFANISMPFWGEGYINFGYLGIILSCILLAYFTRIVDNAFWTKKNKVGFGLTHTYDGLYLLILGALLFVLRGDLLSSFAFLIGTICVYYIVVKLCFKTNNY